MKRFFYVLLFTLLIASFLLPQNVPPMYGPFFSAGVSAGFNDGGEVEANFLISEFAEEFPLSARFSIGYIFADAGNPELARKVFINDATNGTPSETGHRWDAKFDFLLRTGWFNQKTYLSFGPRFSFFNGNFDFVGGNEVFDITSSQFGLGAGIESHFAVSHRLSLVLGAGADYFFDSEIGGHDTAYHPDGQNINPRKDYTYDDADDALNQPKIEFRITTGFNYQF